MKLVNVISFEKQCLDFTVELKSIDISWKIFLYFYHEAKVWCKLCSSEAT